MPSVFITATGTDIGKTYLACALIRELRKRGRVVEAVKPVASGFDSARAQESDSALLLKALSRPVSMDEIARISPWRFAAPLSPDLAAAAEGRGIDFDAVVAFSKKAARDCSGTLLIEGIGGVMVPLDGRHTVLDWIAAQEVPVLLVSGSYLGSISHTLTCLEVLRRRAVSMCAVIINETPGSTVTVAQTIESVSQFASRTPVVGLGRGEQNAIEQIVELIL